MKKLIIVTLLCLSLAGCAWGTRRPFLTYTPVLPSQPKNNISVKVNLFVDRRSIKDTVGYSRNALGMKCAKVVPRESVSEWVTNSLKTELVNAGYTISSDEHSTTAIIEGASYDVFCDAQMTYEGRVVLQVILKKEGNVVLNKNYSATKSGGTNWAATDTSFAKTLEMTLQEVIKQAVFDINEKLINGMNLGASPKPLIPQQAVGN